MSWRCVSAEWAISAVMMRMTELRRRNSFVFDGHSYENRSKQTGSKKAERVKRNNLSLFVPFRSLCLFA